MNKQTFDSADKINDLFSICSSTQAGVIGLLAQSESLGVDPVPFLEALARELNEPDRGVVEYLASKCREGLPLVEVIEAGSGFFPAPVILAVRLAHDSNTLDELCVSISNRPIHQPRMVEQNEQSSLRRITSVLSRGLTLISVMTFVMLFIIPQFQEMFEEFGVELPNVTVLLIMTATLFVRYGLFFCVAALVFTIWYLVGSRKNILRTFSPSRWNQIEHSPAVQAKLSLAWVVESGVEFTKGLEHLARFEPNKRMSSRVEKAAVRSAAGQSPWKALGITGVLSSKESQALETAQSPGTRSWLLRQLAMAQSTRLQSWSVTRERLFSTLANVVLGLLVLLFCVGIFAPLIHIIRGLSS